MAIKIQINKSTNNINKLRIYLRAVPKWGKTTLFRNIVLEKYNGELGTDIKAIIPTKNEMKFLVVRDDGVEMVKLK